MKSLSLLAGRTVTEFTFLMFVNDTKGSSHETAKISNGCNNTFVLESGDEENHHWHNSYLCILMFITHYLDEKY